MSESQKNLIRHYIDASITPQQLLELDRLLKTDANSRELFLQELNLNAALEDIALGATGSAGSGKSSDNPQSLPRSSVQLSRERVRIVKWPFAVAVVAVVVTLMSSPFFSRPRTEPSIAIISGVSGPLQWTGNDGRVVHDLAVGDQLSGGTIDGLSPESWFELEFNDGSSVAISGNSMLTFSDQGQKQLHLKSGRLAANVSPQPVGNPMLIHTQSSLLTVVGTSFEVDAGLADTSLKVTEGEVRLKRLSDGQSIDVPANHRVVASPDRELIREKLPDSVNRWRSQLYLGPNRTYGQWSPATADKPASLKAIPFVPQEFPSVTLHLLGLPVSRSDNSPVIVKPGSRFVLRGRLTFDAGIYFGIHMSHAGGEFAGKYRTTPDSNIRAGDHFEVEFQLSEFELDPVVHHLKDKLPARPDNLLLTGVWCFTHTGEPSGLEITEVELIPLDLPESD